MAATRLLGIYIYLPIITKYGFTQGATTRLVPKLDSYDNNVTMPNVQSQSYLYCMLTSVKLMIEYPDKA